MVTGNYAIIILAAGSSTRLGRPKQLLPFHGKSLLEHAVDTATESPAGPVIVVLGANAAELENEISAKKIHVILNKEWKEGMASSVRSGVNTLQQIAPSAEGVILMVCDQPYVSSTLLSELIRTHETTGKPIVASQYKETTGVPALFHRSLFPELLGLTGDSGARKIITNRKNDLATVRFEQGAIDIDTEADYDALNLNHEF